MNTKIAYFLLFHLAITIFCAPVSIPSEYVSDSYFVELMDKSIKTRNSKYASPSGSGNDCSSSNPCSIRTAFKQLTAGTTLYLHDGKYNVKDGLILDKSGTSSEYIVITSINKGQAILTSSRTTGNVRLITVAGSYIVIENLTFKSVKANNVQGIIFWGNGQNHVIIRNNGFRYLETTVENNGRYGVNAISLRGEKSNSIRQVMIYGNQVRNNKLGFYEAISVAGNCEEIYVIKNHLKDNTNIGIDFYGNGKVCKDENLDQARKCVAIKNTVERSKSPNAAAAGIYVDGGKDIYIAQNKVIESQYGIEIGSEKKNDRHPVQNIMVKKNVLKNNEKAGIVVGGFNIEESGWVKTVSLSSNTIKGARDGIKISKAENIGVKGNSISGVSSCFINIEFNESYSKKLAFKNNKFSGSGYFRLFGGSLISSNDFLKRYPNNEKN